MKKIIFLVMMLLISTNCFATLTVGNLPKTKVGGSTPTLQDSVLTELSSNIGVGSTNPGTKLDVNGTIRGTTFSGSAASLTAIPASKVSGVIPIANLATGTPDGTKFIRDDGTLVTPSGGGSGTPGGVASEIQYRGGASTFSAVSGSAADSNGNIGIGSSAPGVKLDVTGNARISGSWNIGVGTLSPTQALNVNGNISSNGGISTATWTDPINDWNAAGIITTTTGTISSGTNSLVVADATGWSVGMGIAVANAGTGGTTELISYITAINGTTFTLNDNAITTATTQTVNHDDTRALQSAVRSGKNVYLRLGNFPVTSEIDIDTKACLVIGSGNRGRNVANGETLTTMGTVIVNRGKTNNVFSIKIGDTKISNLSIEQDTTISPTAGYAISLGNGATKMLNNGISYVTIYKTYESLFVGNAVSNAHINNTDFWGLAGASTASVYINNVSPAGDIFWSDDYILCVNSGKGLYITAADTEDFSNLKTNNCDPGIKIDDSNGNVFNQRFSNFSTEGGPSTNGNIVISSTGTGTVHGITFVGGETGVTSLGPGMSILNHATDINIEGVLFSSLGSGISVQTDGGYITIHGNTFSAISASNINLGCTTSTNNVYLAGNRFDGSGTQIANCGTTSVFDMGNLRGNINVGIGTTLALSSLGINGGAAIGTYNNLTAPTNGLIISGNVGIGSSNPGAKLDLLTGSIRDIGIGTTIPQQICRKSDGTFGYFDGTWTGTCN